MKNYIVITGASKGLGEGIAAALIKPENHVVCVSRTKSEKLNDVAIKNKCNIEFKKFDLSFPRRIGSLAKELFVREKLIAYKGIYLINNAGVVEPIGPVGSTPARYTIRHININLISPALILAEFIKLTSNLPVQKRVINISSGAASNPYEGWGVYCSGKAGLQMFTRCVALEQRLEEFPVEVMSVAPGVIDTDMQGVIRNTSLKMFMHKERFVQMKEKGILVPAELAGKQIAGLLFSDKFENGGVVDIRESFQQS